MRNKVFERLLVLFISVLLMLVSNTKTFAGCGVPFAFWGNAFVDDQPLTANDTNFTITVLNLDGVKLAEYQMGSDPTYGDYYYVGVPTENDVGEPCNVPVGERNQQVNFLINGEPIDENPVTLESSMTKLDIHVAGPCMTTVPAATSCADITAVGLQCNETHEYSDTVPAGGVISQKK